LAPQSEEFHYDCFHASYVDNNQFNRSVETSMNPFRFLPAAICVLLAPGAFAADQTPDTSPGPDIDRMSELVLLDACGYLRSAARFSVKAEVSYEDILETGTRVEYHREASVVLERPNHLRIDSESDKGRRSFYYDGKTLTVYRPDQGVYATAPAPDTIDAMIDAVEARGITMPASDLLLNHPCEALGEHLQTGTYAGLHYLDGGWYRHLLLSSEAVDVQLWVAQGEAPVIHKLVIIYTTKPGEPQYRALLNDWSFTPAIDSATFTFTPPADARKVAFRDAGTTEGGAQ
jgi:hypothetical protein